MEKNLSFFAKKLLSGSLVISVSDSLAKIISLLLLPIFTYYLSPEDYGIISIVLLISSVLNLVYNPGIISATRRLYFDTEDHAAKQEIIGSGFAFFIIVPFSFLIISLPFGNYIFGKIFSEFTFYPFGMLAILFSLFMQPKRLWSMLLAILYKIPRLALFTFFSFLIGIGLSIILVVVLKIGVLGRIIGMMSASVFLFAVSFHFVYKYTSGKFSRDYILKILKFGSPLTLAIWAYMVLNIIDRYMLERIMSLEVVGIYAVGYKVASIPLFISIGFRKMWTPILFENMNLENYDIIKKLINYFILGMTLISGLIILFSKELFALLINQRFSESVSIIPTITIGIFFLGLLTIPTSVMDYQKKYSTLSVFASIAAVSNIILNLVLIPKFGMIGAAVATLFSYFLYFLLSSIKTSVILKRIIDIKVVLILLSLMILSFIFIQFISINTGSLLLLKICLLVFWVVIILITGIFKKEITAVRRKLNIF